jgi:hypothetical protein
MVGWGVLVGWVGLGVKVSEGVGVMEGVLVALQANARRSKVVSKKTGRIGITVDYTTSPESPKKRGFGRLGEFDTI